MKNYRELFKEANIDTPKTRQALRGLRIAKIYQFIINTIFGIPWLAFLYLIFTEGARNAGGPFIVLGLATMFIYIPLLILYLHLKNKYVGKLEQIYFDEFLSKKLKIFYSPVEAKDYEYEIVKEITVTKNQNYNQRQALITACEQAYNEGADGVIVLNYDTASVTSGDIDKRGGTVYTNLIGTASAKLIKNIKEKKSNDKNDIGYWYDLFQKGAITKEEYEVKKKELL